MLRAAAVAAFALAGAPPREPPQEPATTAEWAPPAAVAAEVRGEVARRWGLPADRVRLEWTVVRGDTALARTARAGLKGSGAGGVWSVVFAPAAPGAPTLHARVRAGHVRQVLAAARPLPRGVALAAGDITTDTTVAWGAPRLATGAAAERSPVAGWITRRPIAAGEPLREPGVAPPPLIAAGQAVDAVWRRGGIALTVRGTALGDAALGERVIVRLDARRRVEGVAAAPALVRID